MQNLLKLNWIVDKFSFVFVSFSPLIRHKKPVLRQLLCLLNLEAHLLSSTVNLKPVAQLLLKSLRDRFAGILNPDSCTFDATAAGACLLDPSVSFVLQSPELKSLQKAAESFVQTLAGQSHSTTNDNASRATENASPVAKALKRYSYLASRLEGNRSATNVMNSTSSEMTKYMDEIKQGIVCDNPLDFCRPREAIYSRLAPVALDLVSAPATQAFVERIFSMCGLLLSGLRNRTTTSLEQRVFLKINKKLLH